MSTIFNIRIYIFTIIKNLEILKSKSLKKKDEECRVGYKSCGQIDTQNRKLCVAEGDECPLTRKNFMVSNKNLSPLNEDNDQILSIFKFSQGTPCINLNETEWNYPKGLIVNRHCTTQVYNKKWDDRYYKIPSVEQISQYKLYEDHLINSSLSINDIYAYEKEMINLYARNFIAFDEEKAEDFSYENLLMKIEDINDNVKAIKIALIVLFIPLLCCGGIGGAGFGYGGGCDGGDCKILAAQLGGALAGIFILPVSIANFVASIKLYLHLCDIIGMFRAVTDEYLSQIIEKVFINGAASDRNIALACIILFPIFIALAAGLGVTFAIEVGRCS